MVWELLLVASLPALVVGYYLGWAQHEAHVPGGVAWWRQRMRELEDRHREDIGRILTLQHQLATRDERVRAMTRRLEHAMAAVADDPGGEA